LQILISDIEHLVVMDTWWSGLWMLMTRCFVT